MLALRLARPQLAGLTAQVRLFSTTPFMAKAPKSLALPKVPKAGVTSFSQYYRDFVSEHKKEYEGSDGKIDGKALVAAAADRWSALSEDEKAVYKDKAIKSREEAAEAYTEFWKNTTPAQRRAISSQTGKKLRSPAEIKASARAKAAKEEAEVYPDIDKDSLPEVPQQRFPPYALFFADYVKGAGAKILAQKGNPSPSVLAPDASKVWAELPAAEKQAYKDKATQLRAAGQEAYRKFWESTPADVRAKIEAVTRKKLSPPGGEGSHKKQIDERPGNPGKRVSPFFEYRSAVRAEEDYDAGGLSVIEEAVELGRRWKALSEQEKQKYRDTSAAKDAKYKEWVATQPDLVAAEAANKALKKFRAWETKEKAKKEKKAKSESPDSD